MSTREVKMPDEFDRRYVVTSAPGTQRLVQVYDKQTEQYVGQRGWPKHVKRQAYFLNKQFYRKFDKQDLKELFEIVGTKAAVALLEKKAVLNIWRNSSPHNWWVSKSKQDTGDYLWHSSDDHSIRETPSLDIFENVHNEGTVNYGSHWRFRSYDQGMPEESSYMIKNKLASVWKRMSDLEKAKLKRANKSK